MMDYSKEPVNDYFLTELGRSRPSSIGGWWMPFGMRVTVGNSKTDN